MKMSGGPASTNIKILLLIMALLIAGGTLFYTQNLVQKLQERERQIVELYAKGIEYVANTNSPDVDITFLFDNIIKPIDFPIVLTDKDNVVNIRNKTDVRNINFDSTLTNTELKSFFNEKIKKMDELHPPIEVTYADTIVLTKIHFGDSELIEQLKFYPYLQIIIASLFIIIGYIGFSNIKRSEQSNIWVGMAKETAHQFGTPLSSLMGWLEMLKLNFHDSNKVSDIAEEITSDIEKLNKITFRFSKIGSKPELKENNVYEVISKVVDYFQRRLPQTGKSVELSVTGENSAVTKINAELFEWVIENLIKNSLDAVDPANSKIEIVVTENKKSVDIEVSDNGKGIDLKRRKDVFRPG